MKAVLTFMLFHICYLVILMVCLNCLYTLSL